MRNKLKALYRLGCNLVDTPAVILLYHRVVDLTLDPQQLAVSPRNFDAQIDHLRKHYNLISFEEFTNIVTRKRKMPRRTVVISFDDGYVDNLTNAIPILGHHDAQAVFYVATATLGTRREFWWDDLERIFLTEQALPPVLTFDSRGRSYSFQTDTMANRASAYDALHPIVKDCPPVLRDELMHFIIDWAGLPRDGRESHRVMTHNELATMAASPAAVIGAHTHHHPKLSVCHPGEQRSDIALSKEILEGLLRRPVVHFSYPFGSKMDYNRHTVQICKDLGFKMVCSNYYDQVHSWHSAFELPRVLVRNWPMDTFKRKMRTFFSY